METNTENLNNPIILPNLEEVTKIQPNPNIQKT
jgi:hypothetical protein